MTHPIIDAEKLADAVAYYDNDCRPAAPQFYEILTAAREYLSTLPRWKEVEVVTWSVVTADGGFIYHGFPSEGEAVLWAKRNWHDVAHPVRLTGTAKVKVTP